jgi:uncharacterized protein (UPF0261 family)
MSGSVVSSGPDRMLNAGRAGTPQIVAPGCIDLVDFPAWQALPERFRDRPFHAHNRLIASAALTAPERRETAREIGKRLAQSGAPVHVILPARGIEEWDKEGQAAHDPEGLAAFLDEMRRVIRPPVRLTEIDAHINDQAFADTALTIFDAWMADGTVTHGAVPRRASPR